MAKQEPMMLGYNQAGMEKGGQILRKLFLFIIILAGLITLIFSFWGWALIIGGIISWVMLNKAEKKKVKV